MQENNISIGSFESCVKCDICTQVCPMAAVNEAYPGPKRCGPDGERYRLKDPAFYDGALKYCLNCKRCEVACPSGVKVSDIIQRRRLEAGMKHAHELRDRMLSSTDFMGSLATPFGPLVNYGLGLDVSKNALEKFMFIDRRREFPSYSWGSFEKWFNKEARKEQQAFNKKVSYFHGCYVNYNYPQLGKDLVQILNACGWGVELLGGEQCCGVALLANGFEPEVRKAAVKNLKAISKAREVLTTSSSCTFNMRDEYAEVLGYDTADASAKLTLATRWLFRKIEAGEIKLAFRPDFKMKITYHTACHMQRLGWEEYSAGLLEMIPGVTLIRIPQNCCGISGTFGFKKENYAMAQKIGAKLFEDLRLSNPQIVATDCETCKWQIEMSTSMSVMNPISIIAQALDIEKTRQLNAD